MGLERRGIGEEAGERSRGASLYHVLGFGNFSCGPADRLRFGYDLRDLHFGETAVRQCGGGTEEGQRSWKTLDHPTSQCIPLAQGRAPGSFIHLINIYLVLTVLLVLCQAPGIRQ